MVSSASEIQQAIMAAVIAATFMCLARTAVRSCPVRAGPCVFGGLAILNGLLQTKASPAHSEGMQWCQRPGLTLLLGMCDMRFPINRTSIAAALLCVTLGFTVPAYAAQTDPNIPFEVAERSERDTLTRSYAIHPHDGREPSGAYKRETEAKAAAWLTQIGSNKWQPDFAGLTGEFEANPFAPLPQYLRVFGGNVSFTIGFDQKINANMSAAEVEGLINYIGADGFSISALSSEDWKCDARLLRSPHITRGIRVTKFKDGALGLKIGTEFSALACQDRRVTSGLPYPTLPDFSYVSLAQAFAADLTLEIAIPTLKGAVTTTNPAIWRKINHEAWRLARAPSVFELMSIYADGHLNAAEGRPAVTFNAYRTDDVPEGFKDHHMVLATITTFGILDDSIEAERWSGLARLHDGKWYLERLYLSQKCKRSPEPGAWTSSPCN